MTYSKGMRLFMTFLFLVVPFLASAAEVTRFSYTEDGQKITFTINDKRDVSFEGLPFPGTHIYSLSKAVMYVKPVGENQWYSISSKVFMNGLPEVNGEFKKAWQDYLGAPTRHWEIYSMGKSCGHFFTSRKAANMAKMNMTDIARFNAAFGYLYQGSRVVDPCVKYNVSAALGRLMGLPVFSNTPTGNGEASTILLEEGKPFAAPKNTKSLDAKTHVALLKTQLPEDKRQVFKKTSTHLPYAQQVRALEYLLNP